MWFGTFLRQTGLQGLGKSRAGRCAVCGRRTIFLVTEDENLRENAFCVWCGSISRNRHVARCIVDTFAARGVRRFRDLAEVQGLRVYSLSAGDVFARVWGNRPHIVYSEYWEDCASGQRRNGILCEDVQRLSFEDESFDLVVSQDVFEHVPDWRRGLEEVRRVLRAGGYHIFTVPVDPIAKTSPRFERRGEELVPIAPREMHGDPLQGTIVTYTTFGRDLLDYLRETGWEAELRETTKEEERRWGTFACSTLVTRRV